MNKPLPIGANIGILGGGQLGRMLCVAATRLGFRTHIYEPSPAPPAGHVTHQLTTAPYTDTAALEQFARSVDVITYEFENIPTQALDILEALCPLNPNRKALAISQDRLLEKQFLGQLGLATAPFADVTDLSSAQAAVQQIGAPSILKTRRLGYDGKGQYRLQSTDDMPAAFAKIKGQDAVLEGFVTFTHEISVIVARAADGQVVCYDPGENVHQDGILRHTTVPARVPRSVQMEAVLLAGKIVNALEYIGVMGVELFVTKDALIVNEIAPRVHNSGHWTQNGCDICQFEQHIRAICGWPLGAGQRHSDIRMENLIGDDMDRVPKLARQGAALHLYGKTEVKTGRKMGHVNFRM